MSTKTNVQKTKKEDLKNVNESSIQKRLSKLDKSKFEKKILKKEKMYSFEYKGLNFEDQKRKRQKIRNKLKRFVNWIIANELQNNKEQQKKDILEFQKFYKSEYLLNDLSLQSLYKGSNEMFKNDLILMLDIVKKFQK